MSLMSSYSEERANLKKNPPNHCRVDRERPGAYWASSWGDTQTKEKSRILHTVKPMEKSTMTKTCFPLFSSCPLVANNPRNHFN